MQIHEDVDVSGKFTWPIFLALTLLVVATPSGAQQVARSIQTVYYDHAGSWVLGQVASRAVNGVEAESATFDVGNAVVLTRSEFGKLQASFAYDADGTLGRVKDSAGNPTHYGNRKRGVPQLITNPDGTTQSAVVSDRGWLTKVTDENGNSTAYGYDSMGRIISITPPADDSVSWNTTAQSFEQIGAQEYGIPAGHWRQVVTKGQAVKITYFDAILRPLLIWSYDAARVEETQSFLRFAYDSGGRNSFAAYPATVSNSVSGIWTEYDSTGRVTSVSRDSEQGLLVTSTQYGSDALGPYTTVTLPGGIQTRTWYQVFASPSLDDPIKIQRGDGSVTMISRDVFGKPRSIIR